MKIIRVILSSITIVLSVIVLIGDVDIKVMMPYMLISVATLQLVNGIYFYRQDKKIDSAMSVLGSIFVFVVVVAILIS